MTTSSTNLFDRVFDGLHAPFWRVLLFVALFASAILYPLQYTLAPRTGDFGFTPSQMDHSRLTVASVVTNGATFDAGVRVGDTLEYDGASADALFYGAAAGQHVAVRVVRGGHSNPAFITANPAAVGFDRAALLRAINNGSIWLFALLVLVRGWRSRYGPIVVFLCVGTVLNASTDGLGYISYVTGGWPCLYVVALVSTLGFNIVNLAIVFLAWSFAPTSRFLHGAVIVEAVTNVLSIVLAVFRPDGAILFIEGYVSVNALASLFNFVSLQLPLVVQPVALVWALLSTTGELRSRFRWLFLGLFPEALASLTYDFYYVLPPVGAWMDATGVTQAVALTGRAVELLFPVALFYGLLVKRALDIGFVLNRVAVYSIVSVILIGAFVAIEFLVTHFLVESRESSILFQLILALAIGISARYVHRLVDDVVDRMLFAKRHADERALRQLAREADSYNSSEKLLDRTIDDLARHTDAEGAAIYLCEDRIARRVRTTNDLFPATIDLDDRAMVTLRTTRAPVESDDSAFPNGMLFPSMKRGDVIGVVAVLPKRDHTAYAPDEREPLVEVARSLGVALQLRKLEELQEKVLHLEMERTPALG